MNDDSFPPMWHDDLDDGDWEPMPDLNRRQKTRTNYDKLAIALGFSPLEPAGLKIVYRCSICGCIVDNPGLVAHDAWHETIRDRLYDDS